MNTKTKIIVGLSGGVDSSVAAHLLRHDYDVHGVFMKNWQSDDTDTTCTIAEDFADVESVAASLSIPVSSINFVDEYWHRVFEVCLDEFSKGNTPNPDILCNKEIKFRAFLDYALAQNATKIATGHYARVEHDGTSYQLLKAKDSNKDQTYFLYRLTQQQLQYCIFPLGELNKPEVRSLAKDLQLCNANKKDSVGICFIGEKKFKPFLKQFFLSQPGKIVTETGKCLGQHDGLMFYTLGQRKGLALGGQSGAQELPWYVIAKDLKNNELIVGQGHDHPALLHNALICDDVHWIAHPPSFPSSCMAKTRYRQQDVPCSILPLSDGQLQITFTSPQWAITPGQSVVFYDGDKCLGGACIVKPINTVDP